MLLEFLNTKSKILTQFCLATKYQHLVFCLAYLRRLFLHSGVYFELGSLVRIVHVQADGRMLGELVVGAACRLAEHRK